jgi:hypothetical protein
VKVKIIPAIPVLLAIGYLAGSCLLGAYRLGQQDRILAASLTLTAGLVLTLFCAALIGEFERIYRRWLMRLAAEDFRRCARCDRPLGGRTYGYVCIPCVRAEEQADTMPLRARKVGV